MCLYTSHVTWVGNMGRFLSGKFLIREGMFQCAMQHAKQIVSGEDAQSLYSTCIHVDCIQQ